MAYIIPFGGFSPRIHPSAFVAPNAVLIGNVEVGAESTIWFGAVLRGDNPVHGIRIGARTSVQDNVVIHVSAQGPTVVGDEVTVGHGAVFESCEIERGALIGMNAVILHHAVIGEGAVVAALSVVPERMRVPPRALVAGAPATVRKEISEELATRLRRGAGHYVELGAAYRAAGIDGATPTIEERDR